MNLEQSEKPEHRLRRVAPTPRREHITSNLERRMVVRLTASGNPIRRWMFDGGRLSFDFPLFTFTEGIT